LCRWVCRSSVCSRAGPAAMSLDSCRMPPTALPARRGGGHELLAETAGPVRHSFFRRHLTVPVTASQTAETARENSRVLLCVGSRSVDRPHVIRFTLSVDAETRLKTNRRSPCPHPRLHLSVPHGRSWLDAEWSGSHRTQPSRYRSTSSKRNSPPAINVLTQPGVTRRPRRSRPRVALSGGPWRDARALAAMSGAIGAAILTH
jgi:hypothetical protein